MPDVVEELEAEPIHEAAAGDETALSVAEKRLRRLKGRPPPLPYNWKDNGNGVYVKLGYSATALGKDWRQPDLELKEASTERPEPQALFGVGECHHFSHKPTELLNPPKQKLTKEERQAKVKATKEEKARYEALEPRARKEEDDAKKMAKMEEDRKTARFAIAVKAARMVAGFGLGVAEVPAVVVEETLDAANALIAKLLPDDNITLSQEEFKMYVFNAIPLVGDARLWYQDSIAGLVCITKDNINLLLLEDGTRFKDELSEDSLQLADQFSNAIRFGPFEETSEGSGDWREADLTGLEVLVQGSRCASEEMVVTYNECEVHLSKLGALLYMGTWSLVTHVRSAHTGHGRTQ